ncbi:hypothetical protein [Paenibacillus polymyxa]|uniref:hypothetical protein n=1 Tax=Paenibacillus polymyxa TaxID=1406 RepID=UPI00287F85C7|nr:hypothetical protein [Paenibacillus polymyxa]
MRNMPNPGGLEWEQTNHFFKQYWQSHGLNNSSVRTLKSSADHKVNRASALKSSNGNLRLNAMVVVKSLIWHSNNKQKASSDEQQYRFFQHCSSTPFK